MRVKIPLEIDNTYKLFVEDLDDVLYHLHYAKSRAMKVDWSKTPYKKVGVLEQLEKIEKDLNTQIKQHNARR